MSTATETREVITDLVHFTARQLVDEGTFVDFPQAADVAIEKMGLDADRATIARAVAARINPALADAMIRARR